MAENPGAADCQNVPPKKGKRIAGTSKATIRRTLRQALGVDLPPAKDPRKVAAGSLGGRARAQKMGQAVKNPIPRRGYTKEKRRRDAVAAVNMAHERAVLQRRAMLQAVTGRIAEAEHVLAQGSVEAALYLVRVIRGEYADASHAVRVDASKAVLDRAVAIREMLARPDASGAMSMNEWDIQQLESFIQEGTRMLEGSATVIPSAEQAEESGACEASAGTVPAVAPEQAEQPPEVAAPPHPPEAPVPNPVPDPSPKFPSS